MTDMLDQVSVTMSRLAWMELLASMEHGFALHSAFHPPLMRVIEDRLNETLPTRDEKPDEGTR